jgi:hypothetical protein
VLVREPKVLQTEPIPQKSILERLSRDVLRIYIALYNADNRVQKKLKVGINGIYLRAINHFVLAGRGLVITSLKE